MKNIGYRILREKGYDAGYFSHFGSKAQTISDLFTAYLSLKDAMK